MVVKNHKGFTLIEVLIVIAIIGILGMVAYPSYKNSVYKTKRADCKSQMIGLIQTIEKQKIAYKRYMAIPMSKLGLSDTGIGICKGDMFELKLTPVTSGKLTSNSWILQATPKKDMTGTGVIKLNQKGQKCWKRNNSSCTLSASSTWDE